MPVAIASAHLDDATFLAAFADGTLPLASFRHGDHLRYAWLQLHRAAFDDAVQNIHAGIQHYAEHHGVAHIFHYTLTRAWIMLLATHPEPTFSDFLRHNEAWLNKDLLHRFWTPEALASPAAKTSWLPPDRESLPTPVR